MYIYIISTIYYDAGDHGGDGGDDDDKDAVCRDKIFPKTSNKTTSILIKLYMLEEMDLV